MLYVLLFVFLMLYLLFAVFLMLYLFLSFLPLSSGLVLSTDLSSLIYPLTKTGEASLEWLNGYLSSVTGVHLDYSIVVQEDPPLYRSRTPTRLHSLPRTNHTPTADPKSGDFRDSSKAKIST